MKSIKRLLCVLLTVLFLLTLCGCKEEKPKTNKPKLDEIIDSEEEFFLDVPTELRGTKVQIAGWGSDTDFDKANIYAEFTELTGIELERVFVNQAEYIVKLSSLIAADQSPDVITENGDFPRTLKILQPITKEETGIDVNDPFWDKKMTDFYTIDGKIYIVSGARSSGSKAGGNVYFNKTTLEENNIKTPNQYVAEDNWNLESLEKLLSEMKAVCGYSRAPASIDVDIWTLMFGAKQLEWDSAKGEFKSTVSSPEMRTALSKLLTLQDKGLVKIIAGHDDSIANGTSGFQICGSYGLKKSPGWFYTMDADDLGFEVLPKVDKNDADYPYTISLHGYGIVRGARNPLGAGYYLRYYLNEDHVNEENVFKNDEAKALFNKLRQNANYEAATFYRGVRMILEPNSSGGTMLSIVINSTSAQISTNLVAAENQINLAVKEANNLIQEVIFDNN